ncbi:MAG: c-type cytochrome [Bryobacteraceae bacterium]
MIRALVFTTACVLSSLTATICFAANSGQVARGRYLAEVIARCQDCHTPALPSGEADRNRWLKGARLDFKPTAAVPGWQDVTPNLTPDSFLWKSWGESGVFKFLTTGLTSSGQPARPPMPAYKMKPADARAVIAYLRSLK